MERIKNPVRNLKATKPHELMYWRESLIIGNVEAQITATKKRESIAVGFCMSAHLFTILEYSTGIVYIKGNL